MATLLDTLVVKLGFNVDDRALENVQAKIKRTQQNIGKAARATGAAGLALTGAATAVGVSSYSFDKAQQNLRAVLLITEKDVAKPMRDQAKALGRATMFSASEVSDAQTALARVGFEMNQIIGASPHVLNLAAAGQLGMAEAAELVSKQLSLFNLDVSQTQRVTDVLAKAAASSATTVGELADSFRQGGQALKNTGHDIETTAAMFGILRNQGGAAEQAGTHLRAMFTKLTKPMGRAREAAARLGMDIDEMAKRSQSGQMVSVLRDLKEAGMTFQDASDIFGSIAGTGALALVSNIDSLDELIEKLRNAEGTTQTMADIQMEGSVGAWEKMKSAIEGMNIAIGEAGFSDFMEDAFDLVGRLANWVEMLPDSVKYFIGVVLAAGPILLGLSGFLFFLSGAIGAVNAAFIASPIGWYVLGIVAGIILLVTALLYAWEHSETFRDIVTGVWNAISTIVGGAVKFIWSLIRFLWNFIIVAAQRLGEWLKKGFEAADTILKNLPIIRSVYAILKGIVGGVAKAFGWIWEGIKWLGGGIMDFFGFLGKETSDFLDDASRGMEVEQKIRKLIQTEAAKTGIEDTPEEEQLRRILQDEDASFKEKQEAIRKLVPDEYQKIFDEARAEGDVGVMEGLRRGLQEEPESASANVVRAVLSRGLATPTNRYAQAVAQQLALPPEETQRMMELRLQAFKSPEEEIKEAEKELAEETVVEKVENTQNVEFNFDNEFNFSAPKFDADEIVSTIQTEFSRQTRTTAENFDSVIDR